jgi:methionyl-tRNA formyltransferase
VAERALRAGAPLLRPERIGAPDAVEALRALAPDLGVVVAFGQFVPRAVRELPALGYCINGHASLLPRYRGAAPIVRAILDGAEETGISVMRVEREMDAGPVALVRRTRIGPEETGGELEERLAGLAADAIAEAVEAIAGDRIEWTPQDESAATTAPKLERDEARIRWSDPCRAIARRVRAFAPSPGAFTQLDGEVLRILAARAEPGATGVACGGVRRDAGGALRIACADGWLLPLRVQRAGGVAMDVSAFLRGHPVPDGTRLGD